MGKNDLFLPGCPTSSTVPQSQEKTDVFCLLLEVSSSGEGGGGSNRDANSCSAGNQQAPNFVHGGKGVILEGRLGLSSKGRENGWVSEGEET